MLSSSLRESIAHELGVMHDDGLTKSEVEFRSAQGARIELVSGATVTNLCANNYLGLANDNAVVRAAHAALDQWGFGTASVRFIVGTQSIHRELETRLSRFLGTDATILFGSCFDANAGLFEVLLTEGDTVISDSLNHASIIDGVRLCKARKLRYANRDMEDLERQLVAASGSRRILVVTDGVFSMDGYIAPIDSICDLAEKHGAMVMVDDSHAVGFVGEGGRGTPELFDAVDRVDILTGTLGKALGGASGGYVSGRGPIVDLLRQRARPYLFSNAVPPVVAATSLAVLDLIEVDPSRRERLWENTRLFRTLMAEAGIDVLPGEHPIVPVMFGSSTTAVRVAADLLGRGVHAVAFSFPVVPRDQARIRVQISAAHSTEDIRMAVDAFVAATAEA